MPAMLNRPLLLAFAIATPIAIIALMMLGWFDIALAMGLAVAEFALLIWWRQHHGGGQAPLFSHSRQTTDGHKAARVRSVHVQLALGIGGAIALWLLPPNTPIEPMVVMVFAVGFLAYLSWVYLPR
jgi:hypothetical protein